MGYDRYDTRRGYGDEGSRWQGDDRFERERGFRGRDDERSFRGRDEERGFFERAGEEIRSWFGGDDEHERGDDRREWFGGREHRGDEGRYRPTNWSRGERGFGEREPRERGGFNDRRQGFSGSQRGERGFGDRDFGGHDRDRERGRWGDDGRDYRPMTGDYSRRGFGGRLEGGRFSRSDSDFDRDEYRRTSFAGSRARSNHDDPHYHECRQRHLDEFERDYDAYRREHGSRFENDFGSWREQRQSKRQLLGRIREHMEVLGSDGKHVGTIDRVAGDRIILTKSDPDAGGAHHSLSCTDLDRIEGDRLFLSLPADRARDRWRDEDRERALFEREDQGSAGPHMLDRSFSGTYR